MNYIIDQEQIVKLFMDMACISTPSFYEKPLMNFIETYLQNKKVEIKRIP